MKNIYQNVTELIGRTPIIRLNRIEKKMGFSGELYAKVEFFNPGGSVKDRIALAMLETARNEGIINEHSTIIEPTSGNTGVGLAMLSAYYGYKAIFVMPDSLSVERRGLLKAYGAQLVLTPAAEGIKGAIAKALELKETIPGAFIPSQFENPANPKKHYETTGVEIYQDLEGALDVFIVGIGTGGTITGAGCYLKQHIPCLHIVAVEPEDSPILSKGISGKHKIQGIGTGFIPQTLNTDIYDEVIRITNEEAYEKARELAQIEGILVGISSGAALSAAYKYIKNSKKKHEKILIILPDTGERYLSTELFAN